MDVELVRMSLIVIGQIFKKCVYYDVYDVSQFLKIGTNILEVELGNGMYNPAPLKFIW